MIDSDKTASQNQSNNEVTTDQTTPRTSQSPRQHSHPGRPRRAVHSGMTPRANDHGLAAARKRAMGKGQGHPNSNTHSTHHRPHHHRHPHLHRGLNSSRPSRHGGTEPATGGDDVSTETRHAEPWIDGAGKRTGNECIDNTSNDNNIDVNAKDVRRQIKQPAIKTNSSSTSSSSSLSLSSSSDSSCANSTRGLSSFNCQKTSSSSSLSPRDLDKSSLLSLSLISSSLRGLSPSSSSSVLYSSNTTTTTTTTTIMTPASSSSSKMTSSSSSPSLPSSTTTTALTTKTKTGTSASSVTTKHRNWKSSDNLDPEPTDTDLHINRQISSLDSSFLSDDVFSPRIPEHSDQSQTQDCTVIEHNIFIEDDETTNKVSKVDECLSGHPFIMQDGDVTPLCQNNVNTTRFTNNDTGAQNTKNSTNNISSPRNVSTDTTTQQALQPEIQYSKPITKIQASNQTALLFSSTHQNIDSKDSIVSDCPGQLEALETRPPILAKSAWLTHDQQKQSIPSSSISSTSTPFVESKGNSQSDAYTSNQTQHKLSSTLPETRGKHCANIERRAVLAAAALYKPATTLNISSHTQGNAPENSIASQQQQQQKRTHPLIKSKSSWRIHAARARESVANLISLVKFKDKDSTDCASGPVDNGDGVFLLPRNKSSPCFTDTMMGSGQNGVIGVAPLEDYRYSSSVDVLCEDDSSILNQREVSKDKEHSLSRETFPDENTELSNSKMDDDIDNQIDISDSTKHEFSSFSKNSTEEIEVNLNQPFQKSCEVMSDQVQDNLEYDRKAVEDALGGECLERNALGGECLEENVHLDSIGSVCVAGDEVESVQSENTTISGVENDAVYLENHNVRKSNVKSLSDNDDSDADEERHIEMIGTLDHRREDHLEENVVATNIAGCVEENVVATNIARCIEENVVATNIAGCIEENVVATNIARCIKENVVATNIAGCVEENVVATNISECIEDNEMSRDDNESNEKGGALINTDDVINTRNGTTFFEDALVSPRNESREITLDNKELDERVTSTGTSIDVLLLDNIDNTCLTNEVTMSVEVCVMDTEYWNKDNNNDMDECVDTLESTCSSKMCEKQLAVENTTQDVCHSFDEDEEEGDNDDGSDRTSCFDEYDSVERYNLSKDIELDGDGKEDFTNSSILAHPSAALGLSKTLNASRKCHGNRETVFPRSGCDDIEENTTSNEEHGLGLGHRSPGGQIGHRSHSTDVDKQESRGEQIDFDEKNILSENGKELQLSEANDEVDRVEPVNQFFTEGNCDINEDVGCDNDNEIKVDNPRRQQAIPKEPDKNESLEENKSLVLLPQEKSGSDNEEATGLDIAKIGKEKNHITNFGDDGPNISSKRRGSTSSLPSTKPSKRGSSRREKSKRVEHLLSNQLFKKHLSKHADVIERKVFGMHNRCLKKSISNFDLSSAQSACIQNIVQHLVHSDADDAEDESDNENVDKRQNHSGDNDNVDSGDDDSGDDSDIKWKNEGLQRLPKQTLLRTKSLYLSSHSRTTQRESLFDQENLYDNSEQLDMSYQKLMSDTENNEPPDSSSQELSRKSAISPTNFPSSYRAKRIHIPSFNEYKLRKQTSTDNTQNDIVTNDVLPTHKNDIYVIDETDDVECKQQEGELVSSQAVEPKMSNSADDKPDEVVSSSTSDNTFKTAPRSTKTVNKTSGKGKRETTPKRKSATVFVHPAIVVTSDEYAGLEVKGRQDKNNRQRSPMRSATRNRPPIGEKQGGHFDVPDTETDRDKDNISKEEGGEMNVPEESAQSESPQYTQYEHSDEENLRPEFENHRNYFVENACIFPNGTSENEEDKEETSSRHHHPVLHGQENNSMLASLGFSFDPWDDTSPIQHQNISKPKQRLEYSKSLDLSSPQKPTNYLTSSAHSSPSSSRSASPIPSNKVFPLDLNQRQKSSSDQNVYDVLVGQVVDTTINSHRRQIDKNSSKNQNISRETDERFCNSNHLDKRTNSMPSSFERGEKASVNSLELSDVAAGIDDNDLVSDDVKSYKLDETMNRGDNALQRRSPDSSASDSENKTSVLRSISDVSTMVSDDKEKRRRERKERPYKSDPFIGPNQRPTLLLSPDCNISVKDTLSPSTSCSFPSLEELAEQSDSNSMYEDEEDDSRKRLNRLSTASSASEDSGVASPYGGGDRKTLPKCSHCIAYTSNYKPGTLLDTASPTRPSSPSPSPSSSSPSLFLSPTTTSTATTTTTVDAPPDSISGLSAIPRSSLCTKCVMKSRERKETIQEIAETEKRYGRDLAILKDEFYRPIKGTSLLTLDQLDSIFLNLDDLIFAHKKFMDKLTTALVEAVRQGDEGLKSVEVGSVFVDSSTMFLAFENYCVNQAGSSTMLEQVEKEKELLKLFLQVAQNENPKLRRMHLKSFLMSPVQRVMKYPLLLGRLYKTTPCYHGDKHNIRQAQEKIEDILEHINNKTNSVMRPKSRNHQNGGAVSYSLGDKIEVNRVALDVLGWPKKDVCDILTSRLWYGQMPDGTWASKRARNVKFSMVHAALLSHGKPGEDNVKSTVKQVALVLVREKGGKYSLVKEPFLMDRCVVTVDSSYDHVFELHEQGKDTYLFKGDHSKQTRVWSKQLQDLSRRLGFWRRRRNGLPNILLKTC